MNAPSDRVPVIPGTHNSRDLGGIPADQSVISEGMLVRSDAPLNTGAEAHLALRARGITTAIDLREPFERDLDPVDLGGSVSLVNWPLIDGRFELDAEIGLIELYDEIIEHCGERFAGVVDLLASTGTMPAVIFCSAGKDRTGLVTALILSAMGADDDAVTADYTRSEAALGEAFRAKLGARASAAGFAAQPIALESGTPPGVMREILRILRVRHGGAADYLVGSGLSPAALHRLRDALLRSPELG